MAEIETIVAQKRDRAGKGAARATRREGRVPGVIYGGKEPPQPISLDYNYLLRVLRRGGFMSSQFMVDLGEGEPVRVIPRDLQLDPVRDLPVHVDLLRLVKGATINVEIPVIFVGEEESPGLKRGGVLNVVRHDVELICPIDSVPEQIEGDLSGLEIGDGLHISAIKLPDGVSPAITDRDFTIATIAAPTVEAAPSEEVEGEAAEAGEGAGEGEAEDE